MARPESLYPLPKPPTIKHFVFAADVIDEAQSLRLLNEQALIDLVRDELAANRPCVIYVRQTQIRDLQPRLMDLIQRHVSTAKPYILKNTVAAERREAVIDQQVQAGINVLITNPELALNGEGTLLIQRGSLAHLTQFSYIGV